MSDYRPVDCELHDHYEAAVLLRRELLLHWRDEGGVSRRERVLPRDLETRPDGEFLLATGADGAARRIRLDRILSAQDPVTGASLSADS